MDSQHDKVSQTLVKSATQNFFHIFSSLPGKINSKIYLLLIFEILGLFVNILTADGKHSLLNKENLLQQIQMQLCKKQKPFSKFIAAFLKSASHFQHFQKKDDPHILCISKIIDCERRG